MRNRASSMHIFFATNPTMMSSLRRALKHFTDLKLIFNTGRGEDGVQGIYASECEDHLRITANLQKFLAAAPILRKLHVTFDVMDWEWQATDLEYVVSKCTWNSWEEVTFRRK